MVAPDSHCNGSIGSNITLPSRALQGGASTSNSEHNRQDAAVFEKVVSGEMLEVDMITTADLRAQTRRELADLAKNYGVPGWHGLKKDELVDEIRKVQRRLRRKANSESKERDREGDFEGEEVCQSEFCKATKAKEASKRVKKSPASKASSPKTKTTKRTVGSNSPNSSKPLPKLPEPKVSAKRLAFGHSSESGVRLSNRIRICRQQLWWLVRQSSTEKTAAGSERATARPNRAFSSRLILVAGQLGDYTRFR